MIAERFHDARVALRKFLDDPRLPAALANDLLMVYHVVHLADLEAQDTTEIMRLARQIVDVQEVRS